MLMIIIIITIYILKDENKHQIKLIFKINFIYNRDLAR